MAVVYSLHVAVAYRLMNILAEDLSPCMYGHGAKIS